MKMVEEVDRTIEETRLTDPEGLCFPPETPLPDGYTLRDVLRDARRFHVGDPSAPATVDSDLLPAVMHTLRRLSLVRTDYPLMLLPDGKVQPFVEFLADFFTGIDDSEVLSNNLVRIQRRVLDSLTSVADAAKVIGLSCTAVADELGLNEKVDLSFRTRGSELVQSIPVGTKLVPCSGSTGPSVAMHLIEFEARATTLRQDVITMREALYGMSNRESSVEVMGVDASKMEEILAKTASGSVPMDEARTRRIESAIGIMDHWLKGDDSPLVVVRSNEAVEFEHPSSTTIHDADSELFLTSIKVYDDIAERYAPLFGALRTSRLELVNAFESPRHDHLLEGFCRKDFSDAELALMPKVVGVGTVADATANMASLSTILRSSRPITLVLLCNDLATLDHERIELAYLAIAHRKVFASQTSIAHPSHMIDSFQRGCESIRPTLHTVASEDKHPLGSWVKGNAAVEGRAYPLFRYDPTRGATWADRFDLVDNPQVEHDWVIRTGELEAKKLAFSFTFAHCAMLATDLQKHFLKLPDGIESDDLISVEEWLHLSSGDVADYLPYLWAVDVEGAIHKIVVARAVTDACRDRLDYWRTLRELAGIDNEHVRRAIAEERESMDSEFASERELLASEHATEIESIRSSALQDAAQQLVEVLLNGGGGMASRMVTMPTSSTLVSAPILATNGDVSPDKEEALEESGVVEEDLGDPWIDSSICTSCNDCMGINAHVFAYNEDKQAYIKDASAGTFDEIVRAAEKCPARCIHPGTPLNPNEPGLEGLIRRAAEFG